MPTGACGIHCDVCRLKAQGDCSTCGPGISEQARQKMAAQVRILGAPCPILECAFRNGGAYCLRDCPHFPCERFRGGPYPFSEGFLKMQERRRERAGQALDPAKEKIKVPPEYWEDLKGKDFVTVCRNALATDHSPEGLLLRFLGETILIDLQKSALKISRHGMWETVNHPLLELLSLVYLLNASPEGLSNEMVSVQQLKTAHFFQGPHELNLAPLIRRFGDDVEGFKEAALKIGGEPQDLADAGFKILTFPKVPLYYLLWRGDEEFTPRLSVLFDRSVEKHLSADAIWGLVSLVSDALLKGRAA
jgi:hypothetical protein